MNTRISTLSLFSIVLPVALTATARAAGPLAGWGNNAFGQINVPAGTFTAVAAGSNHSLAIRSNGTLLGWGYNDDGQINVPAGTFTAVAASFYHSLAIRSDGTLAGWGYNGEGQIDVPAGTFTAVAAGWYHSLAIRSDGTLAGWGYNGNGQINIPLGTFVAVAAGYVHSLAIRSDGTLVGWGYDAYGQINVPAGTFTAVAAGTFHSLAIRSGGTLVGWGYNNVGQIDVPTGTFTAVAAGAWDGLAIRSDGTLVGWGYNAQGQTDVPTGVFTAVAAGSAHTLAIRAPPIPAVSAWGLIAMTVLLLDAGAVVLARRRATTRTLGGPINPPVVAAALVLLGISRGVLAEPTPLASQTVVLNVDSGFVSATQGTDPLVVFSHVVRVQGAPWVRLHFGDVQLSGSPSAGNESFVRITSEADGAVQVLNSSALARWGNTSAYFNGEAVVIELFVWPGTGLNRVVLESVVAGVQSELDSDKGICGATDDRVPSSDPRAARIVPAGCSGFLFNQRPNCLLTAGHCIPPGLFEVVEFNVPPSLGGKIRHPFPQDQYWVDPSSIQYSSGFGQDWCQFGAFNNTTTGLSPLKAQGASYNLADIVPAGDGSTLRITGYGIDLRGDPPEQTRTQQTSTGPYEQKPGTVVTCLVDIQGGNSGSAVEHVASGLVYAIITHGYCVATGWYNAGTAIDHPGLQSALACPIGICADCNGNEIPDQCDLNCASPCCPFYIPGCGGSSDLNSNGVPDECESPIGACCVGTTCTLEAQTYCSSQGGTFGGAGTYCEDCNGNGVPAPCEWHVTGEYGACCNGEGACIIATECSCPGSFFGVGTVCPPGIMCPFVRP